MNNVTFTATFTFNKDSIEAFARAPISQNGLGYKDKIPDPTNTTKDLVLIDNPENVFDFIARLAKEHNEKFVTKWANSLVNQQIEAQVNQIKPQVEAQILQPVKDAIQITYEIQ